MAQDHIFGAESNLNDGGTGGPVTTTSTGLPSGKRALDVSDKQVLDKLTAGLPTSPSGLDTAGLITEVALSSGSWTALPATALTDRNGMGIQNPTATQIKLNFDNSESGYVGWVVNPNSETFIDIRDTVVIYAKAASGTPTITIMEVS